MSDDYITITEAQAILRLSLRQVHNYIASGEITSHKAGKRRMLLRSDVHALAEKIGSEQKQAPITVEALAESGQLVTMIRNLSDDNQSLMREAEHYKTQLQARMTPEQEQEIRDRLAHTEGRAEAQAKELEQLYTLLRHYQRPWWKRWLNLE